MKNILYCASYFEKENHHGQLISISLTAPKGIEVASHLDFFKPNDDLLNWWRTTSKDETAQAEYTNRFWALIAERRSQILDWLHALETKPSQDMTLLCWEKSGEYCHRNLVARLLQKHCPELFGGCDVPQFQVGDKVEWEWAWDYLMFLSPFEIRALDADRAYLQWMYSPVKLAELKRV